MFATAILVSIWAGCTSSPLSMAGTCLLAVVLGRKVRDMVQMMGPTIRR